MIVLKIGYLPKLPGKNGGGTGGGESGLFDGELVGGCVSAGGNVMLGGSGMSSGLSAGDDEKGACSGGFMETG